MDAETVHRLCLLAGDCVAAWHGALGLEGYEVRWKPVALLRAVWSEN